MPKERHVIIREIAERTAALNPNHPECMVGVLDGLDIGEVWLAIDFFWQALMNPDDWLIDVRLHDLIYMMHAAYHFRSREYPSLHKLKDFDFLFDYVIREYEK